MATIVLLAAAKISTTQFEVLVQALKKEKYNQLANNAIIFTD
jgi:hypothetical protein